jgi:TIR domain
VITSTSSWRACLTSMHPREWTLPTSDDAERHALLMTSLRNVAHRIRAAWQKLTSGASHMRTTDDLAAVEGSSTTRPPAPEEARWDVFISHAGEDKNEVARPLADELRGRGVKVWYDEYELKVGQSLLYSINEGLAGSRRAVVILSPSFFDKHWPREELAGLSALEAASGRRRVILSGTT